MNPVPDEWRFRLDPLGFGALALTLGIGLLLLHLNLGRGVRLTAYDALFWMRPNLAPREAVIVYMDELSHTRLEQPLNAPWDRRLHARLIDRVSAAGARAIVFDIIFLENPADPEADEELVRAARSSGRVVLGANPRWDPEQAIPAVDPPFRELRRATDSRWGLVEVPISHDTIIREHPPSYPPNKYSLSWVTARFLGAPLTQFDDEEAAALEATKPRWLNYYGPAFHLSHCSFEAALDPDKVSDAFFENRVVFVGASTLTKFSGDRKDAYLSPYATLVNDPRERFLAGVEIQATATLNLLRGDWLQRVPWAVETGCIWIVALLAGPLLLRLRPSWASLAAVGGLIAIIAVARWQFVHHARWFAWTIPVLQVGLGWIYSLSVNATRLFVQNRLYQQSLALYLSPKLVRKFARDQDQTFLRPGAEKSELTILFSDIADFTRWSEGMDSDELARTMNLYFETAVGECIHATDGTVVKYIGDAIFAFWNAPDPQPDHPIRAAEAALRFSRLAQMEANGVPLITRIGLHTGVATVGNFGSTQRVDYTALGESVNLAARMEGLNKYLGTRVLLTEATEKRLGNRFITRYLGRFILKGFERSVAVYALVGGKSDMSSEQPSTGAPPPAEACAERDAAYAAALECFQSGNVVDALNAFREVQRCWPEDGPTAFFVKSLQEGLDRGRAWPADGSIELLEK